MVKLFNFRSWPQSQKPKINFSHLLRSTSAAGNTPDISATGRHKIWNFWVLLLKPIFLALNGAIHYTWTQFKSGQDLLTLTLKLLLRSSFMLVFWAWKLEAGSQAQNTSKNDDLKNGSGKLFEINSRINYLHVLVTKTWIPGFANKIWLIYTLRPLC